MDQERINACGKFIDSLIQHNVDETSYKWLREKALFAAEEKGNTSLQLAFAAIPRKIGRKHVHFTPGDEENIGDTCSGLISKHWTLDMFARLVLILQLDVSDKSVYVGKLESLFRGAEMNELVALYSFLPFFAYPEAWQFRTAEGVRSNIGLVLEAIMYDNPYPSKYLPEAAWNQLVLKAFFTDKDVKRIIGLDQRRNKHLAAILVDYAHERWAAGRNVNPQLWRLVAPYIDEKVFPDLKRLFEIGDKTEKYAAALACYYTDYQPAKLLIQDDRAVNKSIAENTLHWGLI